VGKRPHLRQRFPPCRFAAQGSPDMRKASLWFLAEARLLSKRPPISLQLVEQALGLGTSSACCSERKVSLISLLRRRATGTGRGATRCSGSSAWPQVRHWCLSSRRLLGGLCRSALVILGSGPLRQQAEGSLTAMPNFVIARGKASAAGCTAKRLTTSASAAGLAPGPDRLVASANRIPSWLIISQRLGKPAAAPTASPERKTRRGRAAVYNPAKRRRN